EPIPLLDSVVGELVLLHHDKVIHLGAPSGLDHDLPCRGIVLGLDPTFRGDETVVELREVFPLRILLCPRTEQEEPACRDPDDETERYARDPPAGPVPTPRASSVPARRLLLSRGDSRPPGTRRIPIPRGLCGWHHTGCGRHADTLRAVLLMLSVRMRRARARRRIRPRRPLRRCDRTLVRRGRRRLPPDRAQRAPCDDRLGLVQCGGKHTE